MCKTHSYIGHGMFFQISDLVFIKLLIYFHFNRFNSKKYKGKKITEISFTVSYNGN